MRRYRDREAEGRAMWAEMVTEVRARLARIERGETTARPEWVRCLQLLVTDTPSAPTPAGPATAEPDDNHVHRGRDVQTMTSTELAGPVTASGGAPSPRKYPANPPPRDPGSRFLLSLKSPPPVAQICAVSWADDPAETMPASAS